MIEVRDLRKTFRVHKKEPGLLGSVKSVFVRKWIEKEALSGVSFRVDPGEIVGLIGANGAGKTTLVKALSGIIHPSSGEARVLGHIPWERNTAFRTQIALVMGQKAQLWWDLPAADCFVLLREIYRIPEARFRATLDALVDALKVRDQLNIQIRRLSLGERMKMELIAALLHRPRVVFLDEPTIGLDLAAQRAIRDFILDYRHRENPAMLLTSHYMEDIERLCKRIVILREGKIVFDGPLAQIQRDFADHKIISVNLDLPVERMPKALPWPELGQVAGSEGNKLRLRVSRARVPEAASQLLKEFPVLDMNIEEEEIGTVIESIMRKERL